MFGVVRTGAAAAAAAHGVANGEALGAALGGSAADEGPQLPWRQPERQSHTIIQAAAGAEEERAFLIN